ncbi:gtp cyclohydrolase-2 [Diaporthe amygdali]|uniref:gtp cyclohydrolase-2 n=1 Tax=Phomopsis amygdali TaxID=1214568 RepID=UPI0022FE28C4|nr:gtp cyclohydrolase-2 [Diaporthe amygdali]KAJ0119276.1 gtp cyclohydrolase-2 [Diaporthe amygdali]
MPGIEPPEKSGLAGQWRNRGDDTATTRLPSFYSPRTTPRDSDSDVDTDVPDAALDGQAPAAQTQQPPTSNPNQDEARIAEPPPSLLSPSFTPPSTPGTATPPTSVSSVTGAPVGKPPTTLRPARAVPVDSTLPDSTSGCGTKRPRLVERLPQVECIVRARIPTVAGTEMFLHLYSNDVDNKEHLAIVFGENIRSKSLDAPRPGETENDRMVRGAYVGRLYPGRTSSGMPQGQSEESEAPKSQSGSDIPLVRIHSECYTGETAWSARCDCGEQLDEAARLMSLPSNKAGGIIIYLRQEGRGIGLGEKLKAYNLQDLGSDTVEANLLLRHPADARSYGLATAMLADLGQKDIKLLTNNPDKIRAVEGPNREIVVRERVEMVPLSWRGRGGFRSKEVEGYLKTKIEKMGHMLDMDSGSQ